MRAAKKKMKRRKLRARQKQQAIRFSPRAWAKLCYLRDIGQTEIGGFGISSKDDLLLVKDVQLVKQTCDWANVEFDDASVAEFFDQQVDAGLQPEQFGRIWIHTHPGDSPLPSSTDEETFGRVFGSCDWAVMFILAKTGATYARLQFRAGPGGSFVLPVEVDYTASFEAANHEAWDSEYEQCVCDTSLLDPLDMDLLDPWSQYDSFRWNLTDTKEDQLALNE